MLPKILPTRVQLYNLPIIRMKSMENILKGKCGYVLSILLLCYSCSKDSSNVRPNLTFISVNDTSFSPPNQIVFTLKTTIPNGGDVNDSIIAIKKFFSCSFETYDSLVTSLPSFHADPNEKATITYTFPFGSGGFYNGCTDTTGGGVSKTDSVYFYFILKDQNGLRSDTAKSPKIILYKS